MRLFGHRQSSSEDKDWSQHLGRLSTAKPHSGRGSATETVRLFVGADECNEAAIFDFDAKAKSKDRSLRQLLQRAMPVQLEKVAQCNGKNADC